MSIVYPHDIEGVQVQNNEIIIVNKSISTIYNLFLKLPKNQEIMFFDFYHPKWSDPGAYVTVRKEKDNFIYKLGNHGWSSDWFNITSKRITRYLHKNIDYNEKISIHNIQYKIKSSLIKTERIWYNKLNEIEAIEDVLVLYEVNGYHILLIDVEDQAYLFNEDDEIQYQRNKTIFLKNLTLHIKKNKRQCSNRIVEILGR